MAGRRQNTIPVATRHDQQIQTDVNLISNALVSYHSTESYGSLGHSNKFFEFCSKDNLLRPFSDYYLLTQFNDLLQKIKTETTNMDQYNSKRLIFELSNKVHGLLIRQLRLAGQKSDFYEIINQKEKEIIALQIKNSYKDSHFENAVKQYEIRIAELERQIDSLRYSLTKYQSAEQQNVIYRNYFKEFQRIINENKNVNDLQALLNKEIIPKVNQCEIQLSELTKKLSKDRNNKVKGAIARYARQLDQLTNSRTLDWATLRQSAGSFFTSIEHMKDDDWIKTRLNLSAEYQELKNRHIAILSLIQKAVTQLRIENPSLKALEEFQRILRQESQHNFKTILVNGWVGLGTIHCHRYSHGHGSHGSYGSGQLQQQIINYKSMLSSFQTQINKLVSKYPQLKGQISAEMQGFLSAQILGELIQGESLGKIVQVLVHKPQIVTVDNVYQYHSSSDKNLIFNLKVLVKALLDQIEKLRKDKGINIEFDQGILGLLRQNVLDGINVQDILALYRPPARICQVDRIVNRPEYVFGTNERGVPIRVQEGIPLDNKKHQPVLIQRQKPIKQQKNQFIYIDNPQPIPVRKQVPILVQQPIPSPVYQIVLKQQTIQVQNEKQRPITDYIKEVQVQRQDMIVQKVKVIQKQIPYEVTKKQIIQIQKLVPEPIPQKIQYAKIIQVPTTVPVFVQKPTYEVIQKKVPYIVKRQQPVYIPFKQVVIQSIQVPLQVDRLVQKPIKSIQHCDCQKPQAIQITKQVPLIKQIPKQIVVQKAHFVKGDQVQKLVQVAIVKQVPLIQQHIKQVEFCVQKLFVQEILDEKLIIVQKQKPIQYVKYQPVELHIQKPIILKDQIIKQVKVEVPVPIIIEKQVVKVVECKIETIVEKIVQVPRIQIVQKIVQKIVPVPRIIQKIVPVPQIIQKIVTVPRPVLQIVQVQRQVPVIQRKQQAIEIECLKQILRIQKQKQIVQIKGQPIQTKKIIKEPVTVQLIQQKIVQNLIQVQRKVQVQVPVPLVHKFTQTVPVQVLKDKPIYVDRQVPILQQVPVYYKQPQVIVQENVIEVQKIVPVQRKILEIVQVQKPVAVYQQKVVEIPSQPIVLKQKQLELVYVDKAPIVQQVQKVTTQPHYIYTDKIVKITEQEYVQPGKTIEYLQQPREIQVQRIIPSSHFNQNPIQFPTVRFNDVRTVLTVPEVQRFDKPILQVAYQQRQPQVIKLQVQKPYERVIEYPVEVKQQVMAIDNISNAVYIERQKIMQGLKEIVYKTQTFPEYIEKIVQKIVMLPQIVEVQKKVYMVQEINKLITKDVDSKVYNAEYKVKLDNLKNRADLVLKRLRGSRNKGDMDLLADMQAFYEMLINTDKMPKIIQIPRQIQVEVEKDRPVLVPVYDHQQEIALQAIISKLVQGISKLRKDQIQRNFDREIIDIFFIDFDRVRPNDNLQKSLSLIFKTGQQIGQNRQRSQQVADYVQSRWKSWIKDYDENLPNTEPLRNLAESYKRYSQGYISRKDDFAAFKANFMKHHLEHYSKIEESEKLNIFYIQLIRQLWDEVEDLKKRLATEEYNRDRVSSQYTNLIRSLRGTFEGKGEKSLSSTEFESIITSSPSYIAPEEYGSFMSRAVLSGIGGSRISGGGFGSGIRGYGSRGLELTEGVDRSRGRQDTQIVIEKQKIISEIMQKNSNYQQQTFQNQRKIGQLQCENDMLREDLNQLRQFSTSAQNNQYQIKNQMRQEWQGKIKDVQKNYENQINRLRQQLNTTRLQGSNANAEIVSENRKLYDQLNANKRQFERQTKQFQNQIQNLQNEKKRLGNQYQKKLSSASGSQDQKQRELRRQYDTLKRNYDNAQNSLDRLKQQHQKKINNMKDSHQRQLDRIKMSSSRRQTPSSGQLQQIHKLQDQIKRLELDLDSSKKQVQGYKRSKLGQTAYTSGLKQSGYQHQFQSPQAQSSYRSGIDRYRSPRDSQASRESREQQDQSGLSRESQGTSSAQQQRGGNRGRISRQQRMQREFQQKQEIKSSSSRVSGRSEASSIFKTQMTMREFMDIKRVDDKDNIMTFVMIKVIEKILEEYEKDITNSYTPSNIYFSNFNPKNLDALIVRFGAPITNKKSKTDGLYLAPQVHRGQGHSLKSIVFTLGVLWDEMIHYEIYFKTIADIENSAYEFKVRDSKMNPILKNTLFEMMAKDAEKRLELAQAKRRLSLQRYITSEGRPVASSSRVTSQSRRG